MTTPLAAEQRRRSQIAAAAYERGRRAALAAAHRSGLYERAQARRDVVRAEQERPYLPRSDSRAVGLLDTDVALARAAAYLAAAAVAHELVPTETVPGDPAGRDWSAGTLNRTWVHEDAWRERLVDAGIDEAVLRPRLTLESSDLPDELSDIDFNAIAEHALDVSSTAADVDPIRLSDLLLATPTHAGATDNGVIDISAYAEVIGIDRTRSAENGVDW